MVIFGTGVVTGGLLVRHSEQSRSHRPPHAGNVIRPPFSTNAGVMRLEFLRRMERELDLNPQQREPIDRILKDGQERTKKVMEAIEPRRREEYRKTVEAFRAVLTPAQRDRLDAIIKQQQQRVREQRKTGPTREHPLRLGPTNAPGSTNS